MAMATQSPRLNLIVAACNDGGIGIEGQIPWRIKKDLAFFRKITSTTKDPQKQNAVVMGRKTWSSIPENFRPLAKRVNIVLSREMNAAPKGAHLARSLKEALEMLNPKEPLGSKVESIFLIGGSSVYSEAMKSDEIPCRLYLTRVLGDFKCDTFIPLPDDSKFHKIPYPDEVPEDSFTEDDINFKFEVYEKNC